MKTKLKLDGWPPVTVYSGNGGGGYRIDPLRESQWHRFRLQAMSRWNGFAVSKCFLRIVFIGQREKVNLIERTPALLRALIQAGVLEDDTASTVSGYQVEVRAAQRPRVEIRFLRKGKS